MTFLGLPGGAEARIVVCGGGSVAEAIRRASQDLEPFSPLLDRELRDASDAGANVVSGARLYLGHGRRDLPLIRLGAELEELEGPRTSYLGVRACSVADRDRARHEHRLLTGIDLATALRTAALELGGELAHLVVDLDVLDPAFAPGVARPFALGASPRELWDALRGLEPGSVASAEVTGLVPWRDPEGRTARLAAELARDLALILWPS